MEDNTTDRRTYLKGLAALGATAGFAGCSERTTEFFNEYTGMKLEPSGYNKNTDIIERRQEQILGNGTTLDFGQYSIPVDDLNPVVDAESAFAMLDFIENTPNDEDEYILHGTADTPYDELGTNPFTHMAAIHNSDSGIAWDVAEPIYAAALSLLGYGTVSGYMDMNVNNPENFRDDIGPIELRLQASNDLGAVEANLSEEDVTDLEDQFEQHQTRGQIETDILTDIFDTLYHDGLMEYDD